MSKVLPVNQWTPAYAAGLRYGVEAWYQRFIGVA